MTLGNRGAAISFPGRLGGAAAASLGPGVTLGPGALLLGPGALLLEAAGAALLLEAGPAALAVILRFVASARAVDTVAVGQGGCERILWLCAYQTHSFCHVLVGRRRHRAPERSHDLSPAHTVDVQPDGQFGANCHKSRMGLGVTGRASGRLRGIHTRSGNHQAVTALLLHLMLATQLAQRARATIALLSCYYQLQSYQWQRCSERLDAHLAAFGQSGGTM